MDLRRELDPGPVEEAFFPRRRAHRGGGAQGVESIEDVHAELRPEHVALARAHLEPDIGRAERFESFGDLERGREPVLVLLADVERHGQSRQSTQPRTILVRGRRAGQHGQREEALGVETRQAKRGAPAVADARQVTAAAFGTDLARDCVEQGGDACLGPADETLARRSGGRDDDPAALLRFALEIELEPFLHHGLVLSAGGQRQEHRPGAGSIQALGNEQRIA